MLRKVFILAAVAMLLPAATAMAFHPNEDCDSCHVPHMAKTDQGAMGMPLWNPETATDVVNFSVYNSWYMDAAAGQPTGSTLLCLACHDGSSSRHAMMPSGSGDDMRGSHPQEFAYDQALLLLDNELVDPDGDDTGYKGGTITTDMLEPTTKHLKCTSCHEIHAGGLGDGVSLMAEGLPTHYGSNVGRTQGEAELEDEDATDAEIELAALRTLEWDGDYDIPHLVNVDGIGWDYSTERGDPNNPEDWSLSYGALCRTCHIK